MRESIEKFVSRYPIIVTVTIMALVAFVSLWLADYVGNLPEQPKPNQEQTR